MDYNYPWCSPRQFHAEILNFSEEGRRQYNRHVENAGATKKTYYFLQNNFHHYNFTLMRK